MPSEQRPYWLLLLLLLAGSSSANDFGVVRFDCSLPQEGELVLVDTRIVYYLSEEVLEALHNGLPLHFALRLRLRRHRAWPWEMDIYSGQRNYRIHYHPLASLYQVTDQQSGQVETFVTLAAALDALGQIDPFTLRPRESLLEGRRYYLRMRAELDLDQLPLPLRPLAYLTPAWNLASEWQRCLLVRYEE